MNDKVNVLWADFLVCSSGNPYDSRQHDFFYCIYVVDGSGEIQLNEEKSRLLPGCFYIIRPGTMYSFKSDNNVTLMVMEIKFEVYDEKLVRKIYSFPDVLSVINTPIYNVLKKIRMEFTKKRVLFSEIAALNLLEILTLAERCITDKTEKSENEIDYKSEFEFGSGLENEFVKLIAYIHDNLNREITLQELADKMCLEKSYFLKKFKARYSCTPIKYTKLVKMEKAKELLTCSDMKITEIADELGFQSVHHFSSWFTKAVGVSPTSYIKNNQSPKDR